MEEKQAILALADGTVLEGISLGYAGETVGELVFNTSMTGYQEILTDPSYARQIVMLTAAHVGNTGCNEEDNESLQAWAAGLVIRHCPNRYSNYRADSSLPEWLKKRKIVAIAGVDTRALTLRLRDKGAIGACISTLVEAPEKAIEKAKAFTGLNNMDLAREVTRKTIDVWNEGLNGWGTSPVPARFHVVVYDYGVKHNILRIMRDKGCRITLVPAETPVETVMELKPDGILLSNGPGDPKACQYAIDITKTFLNKNIPIMGICLGFQLLALACGAETVKMKFGHHGANHPVAEIGGEKRVFITSQNHGFTVHEQTLPDCLEITHRSLFDNSLQGIRHTEKPAFGFQGHPEASPGPHDVDSLFDEFIQIMKSPTPIVTEVC